jgi:hypothetical protein
MQLPIFRITMLGDSGVGKTVFMSSMYARLREARFGIGIRALRNDVDLELDQTMRELYGGNQWPPGTDVNEKRYEFELRLGENPIAIIDWVDYRGGLLLESDTNEGGTTLVKMLQESHCVIWMVDMSQVGTVRNSTRARLLTGVGRMAQLSRQAIEGTHNLRSVLIVRTKSDEVLGDNGKPDLNRACEQLIEHLGAFNFNDMPCSAAIPVSSVGRVGDDKKPMGDDPYNVEWPLILALAFLLETELRKLNQAADLALRELEEAKPARLLGFFKETFKLGPGERETRANQQLDRLSKHVLGMTEVIRELLRNRPQSVRILSKTFSD